MKDFSPSVRIHELNLMSLFMRHILKLREILAAQKKWFVDSDSKLQEHSEFIVS